LFLGHFGVALAAKKVAPGTSLGTLVLATQFADLLWPIFLLLGWERVRIEPGIMRLSALDFSSYPISHSLLAQVAWGALLALIYFAVKRKAKTAILLGTCVVSHWFLDWVVHRPDLPLTPWSDRRSGLGLWNSLPATVALEIGLLAIGLVLYLHATRARDRSGNIVLWSFLIVLVILWAGTIFGPPPPNDRVLAWSALSIWLTVPWAAWADRHRESA